MSSLSHGDVAPSESRPDVSIILTAWNVCALIRDALLSVREKTQSVTYEIIVVDDGSTDGTAEMIRQEFPEIHLIVNVANIGFSRANNIGAKISRGRYILLLNTDTILVNNAIKLFVDYLDGHPGAGVCGGCLKYPDMRNHISYGDYPSFHQALSDVFFLKELFPNAGMPSRGVHPPVSVKLPKEVDYVTGAAILIRRELIEEFGLFDERYRAYCEETDFCYRVKHLAKKKIVYLPDAHIIHLAGVSYRNVRKYQTQLMYSSYDKFLKKYHGPVYSFATRTLYAVRSTLELCVRYVRYLIAPAQISNEKKNYMLQAWYIVRFSLFPSEKFTGT